MVSLGVARSKSRVVSLDEVRITREGDSARFDYADDAIGSLVLKLGVDVSGMSDEELLDRHNEVVTAMDRLAAEHEHIAVEVPPGRPQLRYFADGDQWVPRGDVVRGVIGDGGPDGEATVEIDGRVLSLGEFGRMLTTFAGWGMRVVFVPDDEMHQEPVVEVREPDDGHVHQEPPPAKGPKRAAAAAKPRTSSTKDPVLLRMPIYRLRITLADTEPPVWRRVLASGNLSLKKLHQIIQAAMGWTNSHLHVFTSADGKGIVSDPRFELDHARDEAKVKLRAFAPDVGSRFRYEYDLGDCWRHDVVVEAIVPPGGAGRTPRCLDGARACPPEDCGGGHGYAEVVAAMKDARHPRRKHYLESLGHSFEPDAFELDEANARLARLE